jgi:hypothetical protein
MNGSSPWAAKSAHVYFLFVLQKRAGPLQKWRTVAPESGLAVRSRAASNSDEEQAFEQSSYATRVICYMSNRYFDWAT